MDSMKAFEGLAKVAPAQADWSYVPIVAAALRSKASYLRITIDQGGCIFDYDGEPLFDIENLFQIALKANNSRPERHLAGGLYALNQSDPTWVSYESWDGSSGTRLKIETGKVKVEKYTKAPWKEPNVNHRVRVQAKKGWRPFGGLFGGTSGKIDMMPPEGKVLEDLCRFAPIPIEINKTVISKPVDMGRSLVCLIFEPGPEVKRLNIGEQDTLDQTTVAAGEAYSAIVAVGGTNPQLSTLNLVVDGLLVKVDDPHLTAMGIRCVITCPDLQIDEKGQILKDEVYSKVVADLTSKSLALGEMLAEQLSEMSPLDRVEATDYVKHYADRQEAVGEYDDAERMFVKLLEAQGDALSDEEEMAGTLLKIAALREQQGNNAGARECYTKAMELFEDIRPDQAVIATCHAGLASIELAEGKLDLAEQDAEMALALRQKNLDANDLQVGVSYELLARIYRARYQYPHQKFLAVDDLYFGKPKDNIVGAIRIFEKNLGTNHLDVATLLSDLAEHRRSQRRYRDAEPLFKRAFNIRKDNLGENDPAVAETLDSLGELYEEQGRSTQAAEAYSQALTVWEKLLGPEHEDVLRRLNNLVVLYRLYGKFAQAEPLYQRILGLHTEGEHPNPGDAAQDYCNLALLHAAQGKYDQAEQGLNKALKLLESVPDSQADQAWTLDQLGDVLAQQSRYADGLLRLTQAQQKWQQGLGAEHPDLCVNLELLGRLHYRQGHWAEAEDCYRQSLALKERFLGPLHRESICVLGSVAEAVRAAGRQDESRSLHREVILRREKAAAQGDDDRDSDQESSSGGRYGKAKLEAQQYAHQAAGPARVYKRYQEAEHLYLRALFAREQALGPNHPDIAYALGDLSELYKRHRKFEAALELGQRTLALRKSALGNLHPEVSLSLCAQIDIYVTQQRWSMAEPLTREWLTVVESTVGDAHPEYAKVLETQARIYGAAGVLEKQEECNRKALEVRRQALGTEHPDFATSLADLLSFQKKYEEASRLYSFVVSSLEESLGPESVELIPIYEKYAGVLRKLNREALAVELETQAMVMRVQHGLDFGEN
ncbi:tetratricopeptide repeat protein [bacterium]|nr:tetratricopeptide repeat protein [bacterium]